MYKILVLLLITINIMAMDTSRLPGEYDQESPDIVIGIIDRPKTHRLSREIEDEQAVISIKELRRIMDGYLKEFTQQHDAKMDTVATTVRTGTITATNAQSTSKYAVYIAIISGVTSITATIVTCLLTHYLGKGSE